MSSTDVNDPRAKSSFEFHTQIKSILIGNFITLGEKDIPKKQSKAKPKVKLHKIFTLVNVFFKMREREREFLIIPSRICFGLGVGYFLTKGCCCGVPSICERCLVRGGESFRELDFIWDVAFTFLGWVDKIVMECPTMNDAMFIGKTNGL